MYDIPTFRQLGFPLAKSWPQFADKRRYRDFLFATDICD
jgi:hypothetical protein